MSRELLVKHPAITNYSTIWTDTLRDGKSALSNTNKLVRNYAGCTGLKTGSTSLALFNLSASATRDGLSLIAVIMKAPTSALRFSNAIKLLDYGFTNYSYKSFANRGDFIRQISVTKGIDSIANVVYETSPSFLVKKGEESKITYELNLPDTVSAPRSGCRWPAPWPPASPGRFGRRSRRGRCRPFSPAPPGVWQATPRTGPGRRRTCP